MITSFKIFNKIFEHISTKPIVVYHGTEKEHDFSKEGNQFWCGGTFFSTDKDEAGMYTRRDKILYEVILKPNLNIFDSADEDECQKLFNEFDALYDNYFDEDTEPDEYFVRSAKQLSQNNNNWKCIEETPGVLDWLSKNYDGVTVYEDGDENYLIFKPVLEKIQSYKLIEN